MQVACPHSLPPSRGSGYHRTVVTQDRSSTSLAGGSLLIVGLVDRDGLHAHAEARKVHSQSGRRAGRRFLGEELLVRLVHGLEVRGVDEEDRRLHHRGQGQPQILEDRLDVPQALSHLAAGLVELQRTGDDTSGRDWARTKKMGVNTLAYRMPQNRAFYIDDPDGNEVEVIGPA